MFAVELVFPVFAVLENCMISKDVLTTFSNAIRLNYFCK